MSGISQRRLGIVRGFVRWVAGDPEDAAAKRLRSASEAHASIFRIGRLFAGVMLVAFSLSTVWTLANASVIRIWVVLTAHGALNPADAIGVSILVLMGIVFDYTLLVGATILRETRLAGNRVIGYWWLILLMVGICATESITYTNMVIGIERPTSPIAWSGVILRAAIIPACALVLSMAKKPAAGRNTFYNIIASDVSEMFVAMLHDTVAKGDATLSQLMGILHLVQPGNDEEKARDLRVLRDIQGMLPGNREQQSEAVTLLQDSLVHFTQTGEWPEYLVAQLPLLQGMTLEQMARNAGLQSGRKGSRMASTRAPQSRADAERNLLAELGITPANPPTLDGKKSRGVWVTASTMQALSGGRLTDDRARDLIQKMVGSVKHGRAFVAPFRAVMAELSERHLLDDQAAILWSNHLSSWEHSGSDVAEHGSSETLAPTGTEGSTVLQFRAR